MVLDGVGVTGMRGNNDEFYSNVKLRYLFKEY